MNYQRRQDMCRDPVEGRLPFWESAFSILKIRTAK